MHAISQLCADILDKLSWPAVSALLLVENVAIFALAVGLGNLVARRFRHRAVCAPAPKTTRIEWAYAAATVLLNTAVTIAGLWLYRAGWIRFRSDVGLRALADVFALLLIMDFAMYVLHRLAHVEPFYRLLHAPHHLYDRPRPLTLFVLNPPETVAFGALWLAVLLVYSALGSTSWLGMSIYLALNVVSGTVGHLGVEPLPDGAARVPVMREVASSSFHAQHHRDTGHNFGFYTLLWDRLFRTLSPKYQREFGRLPSSPEAPGAASADRARRGAA